MHSSLQLLQRALVATKGQRVARVPGSPGSGVHIGYLAPGITLVFAGSVKLPQMQPAPARWPALTHYYTIPDPMLPKLLWLETLMPEEPMLVKVLVKEGTKRYKTLTLFIPSTAGGATEADPRTSLPYIRAARAHVTAQGYLSHGQCRSLAKMYVLDDVLLLGLRLGLGLLDQPGNLLERIENAANEFRHRTGSLSDDLRALASLPADEFRMAITVADFLLERRRIVPLPRS